LLVGCQWLVVSCQLSVVSCRQVCIRKFGLQAYNAKKQLTTDHCQLNTDNQQLSRSGMTSAFPNRPVAVVIIGGGVIGLSIARALALRGVRDILLIERDKLGAEASSAAAGMLAPQVEADSIDDFFNLACRSRDLYPDFAHALREETG